MQTKDDIVRKHSDALNRCIRLERLLQHYRSEAWFHLWKGKYLGKQIYMERQRFRFRTWATGRPWWVRLFGLSYARRVSVV